MSSATDDSVGVGAGVAAARDGILSTSVCSASS